MVLACMAVVGFLLALWQWAAAWRFPLHQRPRHKSKCPEVTLLKPLKGLDQNTIDCLRSWFRQDYPNDVQILFGVASPDDPVCDLVRQLIEDHPDAHAQLIICSEPLGVNKKVSSLIQLLPWAQHEVIIVSDADVRVPRDFLRHAVAPLSHPEVGLVNCFYRLANPSTLAMRWEAITTNADFWSQVLQGQSLAPLDFALGAVIITHQEHLAKIGGFEVLADHLADDYQLGNRLVRIGGKRIALCPVVVDCLSGPMSWREVWSHQLRWARTIRVCKPWPYAASILSNATLWPLLWMVSEPTRWVGMAVAASLFVRIVMAQMLQSRLGRVVGQRRHFWLAPVKDLLQCALWLSAFVGNDVVWRGQKFRVQRDGRLEAIITHIPTAAAAAAARMQLENAATE